MTDHLTFSGEVVAKIESILFDDEDKEDCARHRGSYDIDKKEFGIVVAIYNLGWTMGNISAD